MEGNAQDNPADLSLFKHNYRLLATNVNICDYIARVFAQLRIRLPPESLEVQGFA